YGPEPQIKNLMCDSDLYTSAASMIASNPCFSPIAPEYNIILSVGENPKSILSACLSSIGLKNWVLLQLGNKNTFLLAFSSILATIFSDILVIISDRFKIYFSTLNKVL